MISKEISMNEALFSHNSDNEQIIAYDATSDSQLLDFRFLGNMIGLALFHREILAVSFPVTFYKLLLEQDVEFDDLKSIDMELYCHLQQLLESENFFEMTFLVNHPDRSEVELCSEGGERLVDKWNKNEFVLYDSFF